MDSSENSVRRLAEDRLIKILLETRYDPARCRGTRIEFAYEHLHDELLSLLSDAMAAEYLRGIQKTLCCCEPRDEDCNCAEEARSAAFKEAAEIAEKHSYDDRCLWHCSLEIADKLRRKASE